MAQKPQRERMTTSTTKSTQSSIEPAATPKPSFFSRFVPSRVDRTTGAAAANAKPKSPWRQLIFGVLILFIGMQVIEYGLFFIDAQFHLNLNAPLGKNVPIIGGLTWFLFIWLLLTFAMYFSLMRFGLIPNSRTMRAQRAAATQQQSAPTGTSKAARKRAARHAATTTATTVSTARRAAASARVKSGQTAAASAETAGISDDVYERVKAAQRMRRRRDAKR